MVKYFIPIVAICLLFLSSRISIDKLLNAVGMPLQIYSEQVSELSLYLPDKAKASYSLALGESVLYQYSGTTGKWLYGVYQGKTVIVKDEQRRLGYRLPTIGIIEQKALMLMIEFLVLFLCITPIIYIFLSHQAKFKKQNQIASKKLDDTSSSLKSNKISNQTLTIINTDLSDGYQDTEKHNDLLLQNKKIQSLEQLIEQQKVVHEEVIHEQKKALEELIKSTEIQYQPQIKDMQVNIDKLAGHITFLKERARVFDVNFDDDTFSNILKGRQFEVFVASVFVKKYGYKVIEWSPDKGFNAGIFSESNLHSDLLIQDKHGCLFAVECKYRGDYYFYTRNETPPPKELSWGTKKQGYNYKLYGQVKNVDVYVAIGFKGDASNPNSNFLVPLNTLFKKSVVKRNKDKNNYVLTLNSIAEFKVKDNNFYDLISSEVTMS